MRRRGHIVAAPLRGVVGSLGGEALLGAATTISRTGVDVVRGRWWDSGAGSLRRPYVVWCVRWVASVVGHSNDDFVDGRRCYEGPLVGSSGRIVAAPLRGVVRSLRSLEAAVLAGVEQERLSAALVAGFQDLSYEDCVVSAFQFG
jgi:hypothetical protein